MQLPNAEFAHVPRAKVVDYLLNPEHPQGASKAEFFEIFGFSVADWQTLAAALRQVAIQGTVVRNIETIHGVKYIIDGAITTPSGRDAFIRTVWIIDRGEEFPRFVTAHPHE